MSRTLPNIANDPTETFDLAEHLSAWFHATILKKRGNRLVDEPVQRKLAAILAADVVGFSSLMERDEEGTYARVGRLRREVIEPRLSEQQGRLIKTTGDGFLVSPEEAVTAGGVGVPAGRTA